MDYEQLYPENSNIPFNLNQSNQNQNKLDNIEKINNSIDNNNKKYIINKNQKMQYTLDIDSSREEINSKEEIIQTKDEEEIENLGTGKFRFLNTITEQEDNKKEKELNDEKQDYIINNITEKQISNNDNKNDNSNKITNNICIIINKPEMKPKDMEEENKKSIIFEYLNTFGNGEEENNANNKKLRYAKSQKVNKKTKRPLFVKIKNKKNSYKENLKYKNDHLLKNNNSFGHNYFYNEREENNDENKQTLHKVLSQKQKKLKDLQKNISNKEIALKDKKSQIDKLESKHTRSITLGEEKQFIKNNNGFKINDLIKPDDSDYNIIQKNKMRNKNNYYKFNKNSYTVNKSLNSEDKYFKDIPMTNIQTNKYNYLEQQIFRTMSPETDKYNISFNKSIEEKRKMLGIPLKKNDYEKMNKKIEDDLNENEEENLNQKLLVYRKKQDDIIKIYEKRNKTNQESKENAKNLYKNVHKSYNGKSKSKPKNPIRILYKDNSKPIYSHNNKYDHNITNNFFNEIKSNSNLNIELRNKNIHYNNSYIIKRKDMEKAKKHYSNSQNDIFSYKKAKKNKTNNEKDKNLIKKKIKIYKETQNKDIYKKNKEQNDLRCSSRLSDNNNNQKEKKIYENKSYYSKLLSKILNIKNKEYSTNKKESIKTYTNNTINNINTNRNYINSNYMRNLLTNNTNNNDYNININNPKNEPQSYKTKEVLSPQKNDEIMTVENNIKGKTIHIIKKRNKSPQINQSNRQYSPETKKQNMKIESTKQDNEKEQIKMEKKEYKNNLKGPGRGISALRRINQKIENYKKRINTRKRRKTKSKNPQFKSSSQLKQKFGKHVFLKVKQNKSINNLPNVNKDFQNFYFIDSI